MYLLILLGIVIVIVGTVLITMSMVTSLRSFSKVSGKSHAQIARPSALAFLSFLVQLVLWALPMYLSVLEEKREVSITLYPPSEDE